jgi:hypothetical protein
MRVCGLNDPIPQPREARRAGRNDCNRDALAGFAVTHGSAIVFSCITKGCAAQPFEIALLHQR